MVYIMKVCFGLSKHIIEPVRSLVRIGHTQSEPDVARNFAKRIYRRGSYGVDHPLALARGI